MTPDVARDLRTPLRVITGYLEALCDGALQGTPARFRAMYHEATVLKRLIEDLRTLSLADAGELKLIYQSLHFRTLLPHRRIALPAFGGIRAWSGNRQVDCRITRWDNRGDQPARRGHNHHHKAASETN
jgi:signal transduction histidine kinase